jgi:alpha-ketoglutarate-dependent 2,4-dichlorophenoxyacetate dioxygenase
METEIMTLSIKKIHPHFVGEVSGVHLRDAYDPETLASIRAAMDEYAVLVFHNQLFANDEQLAFAERLDGKINMKGGTTALITGKNGKNRLGSDAFSDVSNVGPNGEIWGASDRQRMMRMANRYWHTDASFQDPAGRYSMLSAKTVPEVSAPTEYADMRAAYDALDDDTKARLEGLRVHHSAVYNKRLMGFELTEAETEKLQAAVHPLVRTIPRSERRSLYLAVHASHIDGWPIPEGRLMLHDLTEHATQPQFVYRHEWRVGDFVIWDNRATMHRARAYDDMKHRRELVRVTTLDVPDPSVA